MLFNHQQSAFKSIKINFKGTFAQCERELKKIDTYSVDTSKKAPKTSKASDLSQLQQAQMDLHAAKNEIEVLKNKLREAEEEIEQTKAFLESQKTRNTELTGYGKIKT